MKKKNVSINHDQIIIVMVTITIIILTLFKRKQNKESFNPKSIEI